MTSNRDDVSGDNCLEYLTMCLKESMRIYPPVPVIARRITKETVFDGRTMPAGEGREFVVLNISRRPCVCDIYSVCMYAYYIYGNSTVSQL